MLQGTNLTKAGIILAKLVAAGMLFGALGRHGYDYFVLLRWIVCGVAAFAAFRASESGKNGWGWSFAIVVLLFNPIIPVHLTRETWAFVDVGVALLLLVSIAAVDPYLPSTRSRDRTTIESENGETDRVE